MFFRIRLDASLGSIFRGAGLSTAGALDFWPSGASGKWAIFGQERALTPAETAVLGIAMEVLDAIEVGKVSFADAKVLISSASEYGRSQRVREVVSHQIEVIVSTSIERIASARVDPLWGHVICLPNVVERIVFYDEQRFDIVGVAAFVAIPRFVTGAVDDAVCICQRGRRLSSVLADFTSRGYEIEVLK